MDSIESALAVSLAVGVAWRLDSVGWRGEAAAILWPCLLSLFVPSAPDLAHVDSRASPRASAPHGLVLGSSMPVLLVASLAYSRLMVGHSVGPLRMYIWAASLCSALVLSRMLSSRAQRLPSMVFPILLTAALWTAAPLSLSDYWVLATTVTTFWTLFSLGLCAATRCFTYGEATTVACLGALVIVDAVFFTLCNYAEYPTNLVAASTCEGLLAGWRSGVSAAVQVALAGILLLAFSLGLAARVRRMHIVIPLFYIIFFTGCIFILHWMGSAAQLPLDANVGKVLQGWGALAQRALTTVVWLLPFACGARGRILSTYWFLLLLLGISTAWCMAPGPPCKNGHPADGVLRQPMQHPREPCGSALATGSADQNLSNGLRGVPSTYHRRNARLLIARKAYHLLAVFMFAPAAASQLPYLQLSLAAVLGIFVLLEVVRICQIPPLAKIVEQLCSRFIDSRDDGSLVLTHQYLLFGCAAPLLLVPVFLEDKSCNTEGGAMGHSVPTSSNVACEGIHSHGNDDDPTYAGLGLMGELSPLKLAVPMAGILVLGIGDAIAAVVGVQIGRVRWLGTKKTLEGTLAAFVSMLATLYAVGWLSGWVVGCEIGWPLGWVAAWNTGRRHGNDVAHTLLTGALARDEWMRVSACTAFVCILEAFTQQIDNLFLPMAYMVALQVAAPISNR